MKKVLLFLTLIMMMFAGCSTDSLFDDSINDFSASMITPKTTVQFGVSKSGSTGQFLLLDDVEETDVETINTKFSIRIDNRIPDGESTGNSFKANDYITITDNHNNMIFGTLRGDMDYKLPNPPARTSASQQGHDVLRYIFSSDGYLVEQALLEKPTLEEIKACLLRNNKTKNLDLSNVKVIWYVAKMQNEILWYGRNYWHVDGILTFTDTENINDIPNGTPSGSDIFEDETEHNPTWKDGEVEIDIHQQNHDEKWNEIKTAIHIRDVVDVNVEIPIADMYQTENDDFQIRVWTTYYRIGNDTYPISLEIIHKSNSIVINVTGVTEEILQHAREESNGDGITVEVHTYYKGLSDLSAWEMLKGSTASTNDKTTLRGQITSAFFTENDNPTDNRVILSYTKTDYDNEYSE